MVVEEGGWMANLGRMLREIRAERSRAQKELDRLDDAIAALEKLVGDNPRAQARARPAARRKVSVATRRKMSKAQKARWASCDSKGQAKADRVVIAARKTPEVGRLHLGRAFYTLREDGTIGGVLAAWSKVHPS